MLRAWKGIDLYLDLILVVVVVLALAWSAWLANDLLWDRWSVEEDKAKARQLTWLIAMNLVGAVIGGAGLLVLALRTSVW